MFNKRKLLISIFFLINISYANNNLAQNIPDEQLGKYLSPLHPLSRKELLELKSTNKLNLNKTHFDDGMPTFTYLRCYYRVSNNPNVTAANYVWALDKANYYKVYGYWKSGCIFQWKNIFYSDTTQENLKQVCQNSLLNNGITQPVAMFVAANNQLSLNYTIWSNDNVNQENRINKLVYFGDSLSDTLNIYNSTLWTIPNSSSWFLGRFSNGKLWVEYLADNLNLPGYNWAIGSAGGDTHSLIVPGLIQEVQSFKEYLSAAKNYKPENTLFTILIGATDFAYYTRSVDQLINSERNALNNLIHIGGKHILLFTLPDVSQTPTFQFRQDGEEVSAKIKDYNKRIFELKEEMRIIYPNIVIYVYDSYTLFKNVFDNPNKYGINNVNQSCLDINDNSQLDYLLYEKIRPECTNADNFAFWDLLHPTTKGHKILGDEVTQFVYKHFKI